MLLEYQNSNNAWILAKKCQCYTMQDAYYVVKTKKHYILLCKQSTKPKWSLFNVISLGENCKILIFLLNDFMKMLFYKESFILCGNNFRWKKRYGHTRLEVYVALSHRILSDYKTILILRGVNAFVDFETFCCYWSLYHRKAFQQQRDATLEWNVHCELWYSYSSTTGLNFDVSFLFRFSNLNLRSSELSLST